MFFIYCMIKSSWSILYSDILNIKNGKTSWTYSASLIDIYLSFTVCSRCLLHTLICRILVKPTQIINPGIIQLFPRIISHWNRRVHRIFLKRREEVFSTSNIETKSGPEEIYWPLSFYIPCRYWPYQFTFKYVLSNTQVTFLPGNPPPAYATGVLKHCTLYSLLTA